jgi:hypothetical protein
MKWSTYCTLFRWTFGHFERRDRVCRTLRKFERSKSSSGSNNSASSMWNASLQTDRNVLIFLRHKNCGKSNFLIISKKARTTFRVSYLSHLGLLIDHLHVNTARVEDVEETAEDDPIPQSIGKVTDRGVWPIGFVVTSQETALGQPSGAVMPQPISRSTSRGHL